jgi:hypothetical protein
MHPIPDDLELIDTELIVIYALSLFANIGPNPIWLYGFFALPVDVLASQLEASTDEVQPIDRKFREL